MAIVAQRLINLFNPADDEDVIGNALCLRSMNHFTQFLGQPALGFSYDSCNAAVAIALNASYPTLAVNAPGPVAFSAVFGTSRLFTGLDPTFNAFHGNIAPTRPFSSSLLEEHAEQTAIRTAENQGLAFWNHNGHYHLYVDLDPCMWCAPWLVGHPDNWFVHHFGQLNNQTPVVKYKKTLRSRTFGRQMEKYKRGPAVGGIGKRRRVK